MKLLRNILRFCKKYYIWNIMSVLFSLSLFVMYLIAGIYFDGDDLNLKTSLIMIGSIYLYICIVSIVLSILVFLARHRKVRFSKEISFLYIDAFSGIIILIMLFYVGVSFLRVPTKMFMTIPIVILQLLFSIGRIVASIIDDFKRERKMQVASLAYSRFRQIASIFALDFTLIFMLYVFNASQQTLSLTLIIMNVLTVIIILEICIRSVLLAEKYKRIIKKLQLNWLF